MNARVYQRIWQLIPIVVITIVFFINMGTVGLLPKPPEVFQTTAKLLGVHQRWNLFAPHPPRISEWLVIVGARNEEPIVDLFTEGPVTFEKPEPIWGRFGNQRWGWLIAKIMQEPSLQKYRPTLAAYWCNEWNSTHPEEEQLTSITIYARHVTSLAPGETEPLPPSELRLKYSGTCS